MHLDLELDHTRTVALQPLFSALPGCSVLLLADAPVFTIIAATEDYLKMIGRSLREIKGKGIFEVFPLDPDGATGNSEAMARNSLMNVLSLQCQTQISFRYDITGVDGTFEERHWVVRNTPVLDDRGNVSMIINSGEDVTLQVKTAQKEETLKSIEKSYREFLRAPILMSILKGEEFRISMANERTLQVWGRTKEVIGVPFFEVFPELVEQGFRAVLEKVLQTGRSEYLYEVPATWKVEEKLQTSYLDCIYQPFYEADTDTTPTGVICVAHDQTEQVLARKKADESEQRFRDLIAEADVATAVYFGREMRIQYANEAMIRVWGKDPPVVGKTIREALPELEGQPFHELLDHVFTTGETYWGNEDPAQLVVDGKLQTFYFNFTYKALRNADGEIYGILNMATDVTGQVMAKKMVEQSERNLRNTILQSPVAMSILRGDSFVVEVANAHMFEIWGKGEKEMMGKPVFEALPEVRNQGLEEVLHNVYTIGERFIANERPLPLSRNGGIETVYVNFVYEPFREGDGHISGVIVVAIDVTEQVVARKKALEAEETAKLAIASSELGTFEVDFRNDHIVTSPRFDEIFDIEQTNKRQAYLDAVHSDDREVRSRAYEKANETGLLDYEARLLHKNGNLRWVRTKGRIFFDEHRKPLKISGVVQDITEEKQFAEELSRQVKERTQELEQFTYVSHHDLQEPLRKITMFTDMVRADSNNLLSEASQSRLDKVTQAARRMSFALRDVLNYASLQKTELFNQVDLDEILATVQTDLELVIAEKKAKIQSHELPTIMAVSRQMHQLFYNLLNNALKFARKDIDPVITITCQALHQSELRDHEELPANHSYFQISIKDNGIGFDQSFAEKIFVLFQRLHSKDAYAGTGIGLALCKKVVSNHGGKIWAESKPGEGATFNVLLPVKQ